jgi:hypothetical protein
MAKAAMLMIAFIFCMMFWQISYENHVISSANFYALVGALHSILKKNAEAE